MLEILNAEIRTSPSNFHVDALSLEELEREWRAGQERYPWLVAVQSGQVLGYAKAGAFRPKQAYDWTAEVTIYLAPSAQGKGVGRSLYGSLLEQLRERGFHLALGAITLPNDASLALHRSLGFEQVGVLREVGWKMGAWHDVAQWAKVLGPAIAPG